MGNVLNHGLGRVPLWIQFGICLGLEVLGNAENFGIYQKNRQKDVHAVESIGCLVFPLKQLLVSANITRKKNVMMGGVDQAIL